MTTIPTVQLNFRVSPQFRETFDKLAKEAGISKPALLKLLVDNHTRQSAEKEGN